MAYPTIDAPYGLKTVGLVGGRPYTGATRQIPIASGYGTGIFTEMLCSIRTMVL